MDKLLERFLMYVTFDTQSDEKSNSCPSTRSQYEFGEHLVEELQQLGLNDAGIDENGYVMATLPANMDTTAPVIGLIAHMDTSPDMSGANVRPKLLRDYDGKDIVLHADKGIVMTTAAFPELLQYKGQDLVTTDGTTLLGADDKAGIAEIITAVEYLLQHPEIQHGTIKICFTPDEEIGRGADLFNVARFGADFAYTLDGGELGELEYENFNAASASITINGVNVHPGRSKNKMLNAILLAMELNSMLPPAETPAYTENYDGFYHLNGIEGSVEKASMRYIIRDHDKKKFIERKDRIQRIVAFLNEKYGDNTFILQMKDQYYNMKEKIEPVIHIVETAKRAMEEVGVVPLIRPVRGGTDGARLSFMGLPTPNIFSGGHNFHGKFEYVPVNSMVKAVEVIVKLAELHGKQKQGLL